jgi:hypothetical protein
LEAAISDVCTDPLGQPDPDGRVGSDCAGLEVERIGDVLSMVGTDCQDDANECETSLEDRIRSMRLWRAFVGVEVREICNPIICRGDG